MRVAVCIVLLLVAAGAVLAAQEHFGTPAGMYLYMCFP